MATYVPAKRATAYRFTLSLFARSDNQIKTAPTLAAGDVKVSKDNGATANITTLPVETPASSGILQVDLSGTEMTADLVTVIFRDASGAEWNDVAVHIATAARQIDDLAYPATSGRSLDVSTDGDVEANVTKWLGTAAATPTVAGVPEVDVTHWIGTAAATPTVAGVPEVDVTHWLGTAGQGASGRPQVDVELWLGSAPNALVSGRVDVTVGANQTGVIVAATFGAGAIDNAAIAADAIGSSELAATAASEIATAVRTELTTELGRIDAAISSRLASAGYTAPDNASIAAILLDTAEIGAAGAGLAAVPWNAAWDAEVQSEVTDALVAYDPATGAEIAALNNLSAAQVNAEVDTALADYDAPTKAELDAAVAPLALEATVAALNDLSAADILAAAFEGSETVQDFLRLARAALYGKGSGLDTTTATYRDLADTKNRITATVDPDGNRSAVTLDAS